MKDIDLYFHLIPNLYSLGQYLQRYVQLTDFLKFPVGVEMPISTNLIYHFRIWDVLKTMYRFIGKCNHPIRDKYLKESISVQLSL